MKINLTADQVNAMSDREFLSNFWGDNILTVIDRQQTKPMPMKDFLDHCIACGGNWGGMLLTGIRELYPAVYDAIPDNMGHFAWRGICTTLKLLGVIIED